MDQVQDSYVTRVRAWPNPYKEGDLVLCTLFDWKRVCRVKYKSTNYLSLVDVSDTAPNPQPFHVYEREIDQLEMLT